MPDRFWVGGSGNWNATSTTNWAATSGGTAGASAPTAVDDVYFDANSNVGTGAFTVTVTGTSASPALCRSFTTGGTGGALDGAMTLTMGATAQLDCSGSMTLPATNLSVSGTTGALIRFLSTTSQTLTTNGVTLGSVSVTVDGVAGTLTLGSALTCSTLTVTNGTFSTSGTNYNVTAVALSSSNSNIRTISLNGSTVTLSSSTPVVFTTATNLTFNAGTSTITCSAASPTFNGNGLTFHNVTFSSNSAGTTVITGTNTFNNFTQTSRNATGLRFVNLNSNQTVNGTLTLGAANTSIRRVCIFSSTIGTQRTITLNGALAALADVDFKDIAAAGSVARPWTGTRLGDCRNNSSITFDAPKTVYWNLAGAQNWSAIGWATTNNGTPNANNFPLPQDTATFTEAGAAGTVTIDQNWQLGSIQMADGVSNRTTAFTLATGSLVLDIYGNITLFSSLTFTGTGILAFEGQGITQTFTSAGLTLTQAVQVISVTGTLQLQGNLTIGSTLTATLTSGTLNLNNNTFSTGLLASSNSNVRAIAFGTGNITLTGNNTGILNIATATNFTYTGTPTVNSTYSGATGTRSIDFGGTAGGTEANAISLNVTAGTDTVTINANSSIRNLNFTGFAGTFTNAARTLYGNLTLSSGMTLSAGTSALTFASTSGTQAITTNGKTLDFPVTFNGVGGTFQLQDNMTVGSTRTVTLTNGALALNDRTFSLGLFSSSNSNIRSVSFGTGNITLTSNAAGIWDVATATNFSRTGTPTINATYAGASGTRTFNHGNTSGGEEANSVSLNISAGTDTASVNGFWRNLVLTGFAGTLSNVTRTIYGDLTLSTGVTVNAGPNITTFGGTSVTQRITSSGKTMDFPIVLSGSASTTFQLQDNMTVGQTAYVLLTRGTLDLTGNSGNWTLTTGVFSSANTNSRAVAFGTGKFVITGNGGVVVDVQNANISFTGSRVVDLTYSGSVGERTIRWGQQAQYTQANSLNINVLAGTDGVVFALDGVTTLNNVNFTGFTGTFNFGFQSYIWGNLTLGAGSTSGLNTNALVFVGTGSQTITNNGVSTNFPITFDGVGGTWTLQDGFTMASSRTFTLTNGTFNANNANVTVGSFALGSGTKTLTLGNGTWTVAGASWDANTNATGLTVSASSGTISMTSSGPKTFNGGGRTWPTLNQGGTGALTIGQSNTFANISNTVQPATVTLTSGTTQTVSAFTLSGTSGNLITLNSSTPGSAATLLDNAGTNQVYFCSIQDNNATGNAEWIAFTDDGNVDAGNNSGWRFSASSGGAGNVYVQLRSFTERGRF